MVYAGFWKRLGAGLLDVVLLNIVSIMIGFIYEGVGSFFFELTPESLEQTRSLLVGGLTGFSVSYYAGFLSSKYQATPGMMAFSLRIVGYDGKRISFRRAVGRGLAAILSILTVGIGFLMIAFTPRKQALHDYIARTLIVKN